MTSAIFVVPVTNSNPALTMEQLQCDSGDEWAGGYSCIGQTPTAATCMVRVWASPEQIDELAADSNNLLIEVLDE